MFKAIIFDFDGVVAVSDLPRFKFWQKLLSQKGFRLSDDYFRTHFIGRTTKSFAESVLRGKIEDSIIAELMNEYEQTYKENILDYVMPIDMTVDFIKHYSGQAKLAIASMADRKVLNHITKAYGISDNLRLVMGKDEIVKHKPDPEVYLKVAEELAVKPKDCCVIEDSVVGVAAGIAAGMNTFVLLNGLNGKDEFKELPIAGFIEKPDDFLQLH